MICVVRRVRHALITWLAHGEIVLLNTTITGSVQMHDTGLMRNVTFKIRKQAEAEHAALMRQIQENPSDYDLTELFNL